MHVPVCAVQCSGQVRHSWRPPEWDKRATKEEEGDEIHGVGDKGLFRVQG